MKQYYKNQRMDNVQYDRHEVKSFNLGALLLVILIILVTIGVLFVPEVSNIIRLFIG